MYYLNTPVSDPKRKLLPSSSLESNKKKQDFLKIDNTVKPPVRDHPKCQAYIVAYGWWSLTRTY